MYNDKFVITLDDGNDYLICVKVNYEGITYCAMININIDKKEYQYGKIVNDEIEFIEDKSVIDTVSPLLLKKLVKSLVI